MNTGKMKGGNGFTLVEMSIVLVVIGLIVGGVLVGQELIQSAGTRAAISQMEKFNAAVNTFRDKYGALPGDMLARDAAQYGFTSRSGAVGHGDGNGVIEACATGQTSAGCETVLFWSDLSKANLIPNQLTSATDALVQSSFLDIADPARPLLEAALYDFSPVSDAQAAIVTGPSSPVILVSPAVPVVPTPVVQYHPYQYFPKSGISDSNTYVTVFSALGTNYFQMTGIASTNAKGAYSLTNTLTPSQAYSIDVKMDDGLPQGGTVQAMEGAGPLNTAAVAGASSCVYSKGTPSPYNTASSSSASPLCQLRFQFQ